MKRSTAAALFAIFLLAVVLRLLPLLHHLHWGSDFGEYYALTRALVAEGTLPSRYDGWGTTYPQFPGLFVVNGAFVFAGASPDLAANLLVPLLSAFAVVPLFLIAARVTRDDLAALVASAFLAVVMFHVYPTSHAIPASLGGVLLLGALLLFLALPRDPRMFAPLVLAGLAVVVTHHLATYVLVLAAVSALLLRAILDSMITIRAVRLELAFLAILLTAALAFWGLYARSFWTLIAENSPFPPIALVGGAAILVVLVPAAIAVRRRLSWRYRPRTRPVRAAAVAFGLAVASSFAIVGVAATGSVPGTTIRLDWRSLLPFVPTFLFLSLAAAGRRVLDLSREGVAVSAWFVGLVLSVAFGALAAPEILIPYRHLEYLAIPVAVMVGAGARWLTLGSGTRAQVGAAVAVGLLVSATAAAAYPPSVALAGFQEGVSPRAVEVALWVRHHADGLVAGDHRLSAVLFGFGGVNATWNRELRFWHTEDVSEALAAMADVRLPYGSARVDWVAIDADLRAGLQESPFAPALPLEPAEEAKFREPPFQKVFDSGYAQVYFVNWGLVP